MLRGKTHCLWIIYTSEFVFEDLEEEKNLFDINQNTALKLVLSWPALTSFLP